MLTGFVRTGGMLTAFVRRVGMLTAFVRRGRMLTDTEQHWWLADSYGTAWVAS